MDSHHRPSGYEPAILLLNYPAIIQEGIFTSAQAGLPCQVWFRHMKASSTSGRRLLTIPVLHGSDLFTFATIL